MIILDTNVISAVMRQPPDSNVVNWLDRQPRNSIWATSVTVLEIHYGLQILSPGKRRSALMEAFETLLTEKLSRRVAAFDAAAAQQSAELMAARRKLGRPVELRDMMIAGITLACNAALATRNTAHFDDLSVTVVNPWMS
jgi:toxin FitB